MRKYEAMVLVRPDMSDGDVQALADRFKGVIESEGGSVESASLWERRKTAYPVQGHKEAAYVLFKFSASAKVPGELNRQMRIHDDVIRHRIFSDEE